MLPICLFHFLWLSVKMGKWVPFYNVLHTDQMLQVSSQFHCAKISCSKLFLESIDLSQRCCEFVLSLAELGLNEVLAILFLPDLI